MNATSYTLALSVLKTMHPEPAEHRLSPRGTLRDKALFKVEQSESLRPTEIDKDFRVSERISPPGFGKCCVMSFL